MVLLKPSRRTGEPGDPCASCDARAFSMCSTLAEHELVRLAQVAHPGEVDPGAPLVVRGESAAHVFNISSGAVRVCKSLPDGRRQIVGFLSRGDFLGFGAGETYSYDVEALTPVTACRFSRTEFDALTEAVPALGRRLLCMASDEIQEDQEHMLLLGRKTALERVATFLTKQARRAARFSGADADVAPLPMTRADMADYLGLTSETVSRVMSQLRARGVVRLEPGGVCRILRPDILTATADGEPAGAAPV